MYFSCLEAVQNASKHSGAARITIDIRGRFGADGTGEIELTVTDDGRGFDATRRTGNGLLNISRPDRMRPGQRFDHLGPRARHHGPARIPTTANPAELGVGTAGRWTINRRTPLGWRSPDPRGLTCASWAGCCSPRPACMFALQGLFLAASNFS